MSQLSSRILTGMLCLGIRHFFQLRRHNFIDAPSDICHCNTQVISYFHLKATLVLLLSYISQLILFSCLSLVQRPGRDPAITNPT